MKKLGILSVFLLVCGLASAQHHINSFFDRNGAVRLETQELIDSSDSLASVFHRADDVVWSRVVYRIIDMRYKQNYQLYFPTKSDDPQYRNLFKVILDAIVDGMPVYSKAAAPPDITPHFENEPLDIITIIGQLNSDQSGDAFDPADAEMALINYDSITDERRFRAYAFEQYIRNQTKFMIQEIVFFDKHYSRLFSKIIAIAPMWMEEESITEETAIIDALYYSIRFWIVYDDLRPFLAQQYVIPQSNDTKRVTFEQFFAQKLYTSYLIGDSNMYSRMFAQYASKAATGLFGNGDGGGEEEEDMTGGDEDEEGGGAPAKVDPRKARIELELKREQKRVQDELMNFEQDLWEY